MMPPSLGGDGWPIFQKGNILSATTKKSLEKNQTRWENGDK